MKNRFAPLVIAVLFVGAGLLSACAPDTSQPWKDDAGHWHTHRVCQVVTVTHYVQIPAGEDKYGNPKYITVPQHELES